MLWMLSKRVYLAVLNSGQWRKKRFIDSMPPWQSLMRSTMSLKPCLYLWSLRWHKPRRNLVNSFISRVFLEIENAIRRRSSKLQKPFFGNINILRISYFRISDLFYFIQLSRGKIRISVEFLFDFKYFKFDFWF